VGVTNWGSDFTFTTNGVVYYANDVGGVFQTIGAGNHYLIAGSTNRDLGTTNISASLLAALTKKTTWPPVVLSNVSITASTNLLPQAPRDTNSLPDLGFHYEPIDWLTHWYTVSNATLTVSDGAVLASYNDTGVWMTDGSAIVSTGTPLAPNWFTRYTCVQEQSLALGSDVGLAVNSYHYSTNAPTGNFRFTKFTCPAGDGYHLYHSDDFAFINLIVRDCEFWSGFSYFSGSSSLNGAAKLNNNLFYRSRPWAQNTSCQQSLALSNNLIVGASAAFYGPASDLWKVYDNAFEACTFFSSSRPITNGYNAYINCSTNRLNPTNTHDIVLSSLAWQSGFLGDFYQPTNSPLINTGSLTSAVSGGLYHYATTTNQVKESNSPLDIGYHYVAGSNGLLVDTDGDGQADYFEDTNGNGSFDTGDFGDFTGFLYTNLTFASINEDQAEKIGRPDSMGAAGPDHYMAVLNSAVAVYDKYTGSVLATNSLDNFMRVIVTNGPHAYAGGYPNTNGHTGDPRVMYDPGDGAWFASCVFGSYDTNLVPGAGNILLAVCTNSSPIGNGGTNWIAENWSHYFIPMGWLSGTNFIDQPKLAVGSNGVYLAGYAVGVPLQLRIVGTPKGPFLDLSASQVPITNASLFFNCPSNNDAQIVVNSDPIDTNDSVWVVAAGLFGAGGSADTNTYVNQLMWTNGFAGPPVFALNNWVQLPISNRYLHASGSSSSFAQPWGTNPPVSLIDSRAMSATMRTFDNNQYIWMCRHIWVNQYGTNGTPPADRVAVEWFKIQAGPSISITDSGRIFDSAASNPKFYYYPSVAVNDNGDTLLGFSGSSAIDYIGAYYWGELHNGSSLSAPVCYFSGEDAVANSAGIASWGDYSATTLDPDGLTFWTIQEYAKTRTSGGSADPTHTWGTAVTAVRPY